MLRTATFHGNTRIIKDALSIHTIQDAIYIPGVWGLYDSGQKLIPASAYYRGPTPDLIASEYVLNSDSNPVASLYYDEPCYYLGPIHNHYGHFLVASLARLWAYSKQRYGNIKIVTAVNPVPNVINHFPFMSSIFKALGLTQDDFILFGQPTRLSKVIIASPCFEETNYAHPAFAAMFRTISDRLLDGVALSLSDDPVYLARFGLTGGVTSLQGEEEFATELSARGIDIVHPQQLAFIDQVKLFHERRNIVGIGGSAFHTAAFAPKRRMASINLQETPLSNQALIDRACGHDAIYLFSPDGISANQADPGFGNGFRMIDPKRTASELLRIIDPFMRSKPVTVEQERQAYGIADDAAVDGRPRPNLALGRPTRQSSTSPFSYGLSAEQNSAGAVCGFCTGGYQFCTEWEDSPWWDVDLGASIEVGEIRLFNKLGDGAEFAWSFALETSNDGQSWTTLERHDAPVDFGGFDGRPYVCQLAVPLITRLVRVRLTRPGRLHLDQVVIYGPAVSNPTTPAAAIASSDGSV